MKKISIYIPVIITCLLAWSACSKIDQSPVNSLSDETVWKDPRLVQLYVADIYANLPIGFDVTTDGTANLSCITDEARGSYAWLGANILQINGKYTSSNAPLDIWSSAYKNIRKTNVFFQQIEKVNNMPEEDKKNLTGQVKFLRAFYYFELVKRYGGVPLITTPQTLTDDLMVKRDDTTTVYNFISTELDAAAALLPATARAGLANRWTALALKSRAMLYARRWNDAAKASLEIIEKGGYALVNNYSDIFSTKQRASTESIFEIQYLDPSRVHNYDAMNVPYYDNPGDYTSLTQPTQEMTDAYEMQATGKAITDPASGYDAQQPYKGRDPRFYATILYEGARWKGRTIETRVGGTDGIVGRNTTNDNTKTGYYIRKYLDETLPLEKIWNSTQSWVEFRLGEIFLNYAEATNNLNDPATAKKYVDLIRARAQMPALQAGMNTTAMSEAIMHERKIELAFENHRYWDLRRWRTAVKVLNNKTFHGMQITLVNGAYKYEVIEADLGASSPRVFTEDYYLLPIPKTELEKNKQLTQNVPW
ncbi:RagB/SusD family nutrient uptake outer membrane protein [Chitinophaga solisilvae]|uniref:RagB/SusD family nutrient uptake outer membrane protein n=1 Tax=Chitinophaga solisilvae TaxID=1233460 RepID=UPI00136AC743|nr:RagB/SusD family nutrient uptake outer membrane protein [Chitinophaga solisilvae]